MTSDPMPLQGRFAPAHPLPPPPIGSASAAPTDDELRYLVAQAVLAPSGGNLQAWRFERVGDDALRCRVDPERSEYFTNYRWNESYVSLGAAVTNLEVAARALGFVAELSTERAGAAAELTCLARLRRGAPDPEAAALAQAIPVRMTSRGKGARSPLPDEEQARLRSIAAAHGAELLLLTGEDQLAAFGTVLGKLNLVGYLNERSHGAIMQMLRWSEEEAAQTRDGIPIHTFELSPLEITGLRFARSWEVMKFISHMISAKSIESLPAAWSSSASAVALLTAPGGWAEAHFEAGRALEHMWLDATLHGWAFHVWGVISYLDRLDQGELQDFREADHALIREQRRRFGELFPIAPGHRQAVLFRILPPNPQVGRTYRRGLDDVLR